MFLLKTKFGDRAKAFPSCSVAFFGQMSKVLFLCPWQCSKYTYTFRQKFMDPYCFLSAVKKCLIFWQKNFGNVVKISFHWSKETLKSVMSDVFDRNLSSYHFWSLSGKLFDVFENFIFWSLLNFSENIFFVFENPNHYCRNLNKTLRTFRTKTSPVCQISILHLQLFSWRKNNLRNCIKVCFSYFMQKGITDLGRNVSGFHCTKTLKILQHVCFNKTIKVFCINFQILKQMFSVFWHENFSSRSELP